MRKSKDEIIEGIAQSYDALITAGHAVPNDLFNVSREGKWTTAENIQHLATSTKITSLAFTLPKFIHVLLYSKPGRTSHGYTKLVENYEKKLEGGAKAFGPYVPKKTDYNKQALLGKLKVNGEKLTRAIGNKWSDEQLDHYQITHPILGLITVRELAYFTIYHNQHHLETIKTNYLVTI